MQKARVHSMSGKTALVAGATGGVGRYVVESLIESSLIEKVFVLVSTCRVQTCYTLPLFHCCYLTKQLILAANAKVIYILFYSVGLQTRSSFGITIPPRIRFLFVFLPMMIGLEV